MGTLLIAALGPLGSDKEPGNTVVPKRPSWVPPPWTGLQTGQLLIHFSISLSIHDLSMHTPPILPQAP